MKAILVLLAVAALSFVSTPAQADYLNGATIECTGSVLENGVQFLVASSKVYSYDELSKGDAYVFFDSYGDRVWNSQFNLFISGFILPLGPGYAFQGAGVTMNLDLMTTSISHGVQTRPTYRIAQKYIQSSGNTFSLVGSWSSDDHKDSLQLDGETLKYDYNVSCNVLTN